MGIEQATDAVPRLRRARLRSIAATMIETRWCAAQMACAADNDAGVVRGQCVIGGKPAAGTAQRSRLVRGKAASGCSSTVRWRARLRKRSVACGQPAFLGSGLAFGAVPIAARVVRDLQRTALVALLDVTAQGGGTTSLDRPHHPVLLGDERMAVPVGAARRPEDVGQFHRPPGLRRLCQRDGTQNRGTGCGRANNSRGEVVPIKCFCARWK